MRTLIIVSVGVALALLFLAIGRRYGTSECDAPQ